jgi:hypothetical protein
MINDILSFFRLLCGGTLHKRVRMILYEFFLRFRHQIFQEFATDVKKTLG